jgi:hypothetical protein
MRIFLTAITFSTILASSAWASTTACPGAFGAPTQTLSTINSNGGCELVDKQFSNFTTIPAGQVSTIEMTNNSQTGTIGSNTILGLLANFDGPGVWQISPNSTTTSEMDYQGAVDQTGTPPSIGQWAVKQISLVVNFTANSPLFKANDSVTVRMEWCPGQTTVTGCGTNLQFIQGVLTEQGTVQIAYTNSLGTNANSLDVTSFNDNSVFAVRNTLTFNGTTTVSTFPINSISNGFDEIGIAGTSGVPEPSTFVLFGIGLAGLLGFQYRQRRTA